jgi:hypothetical protein
MVMSVLLTPLPNAEAAPEWCDFLQDTQFLRDGSSALISAVTLLCNGVAEGSAPPVSNAVPPSGPGEDRLVNFRTTDVWPIITQSETSVAANGPTVLVAFNDSGQFKQTGGLTGYSRSADGGTTWTDMGAPTTPLGVVARLYGDPVFAADRPRGIVSPGSSSTGPAPSSPTAPTVAQERFYLASIALATQTQFGPWIISVHRTLTGGLTWDTGTSASAPPAGIQKLQDKPWLAVDTRVSGTGAGNVYVCWTSFRRGASGNEGIRFARSTDGGLTWTQSTLTTAPGTGCTADVDPQTGYLAVAWLDLTDPNNPTIKLRRSTDAGSNFGDEVLVGNVVWAEGETQCGPPNPLQRVFLDTSGDTTRAIRSKPFPSISFDPTNSNVYVTWHAANLSGGNGADIALNVSTNDGSSWPNPPVRINSSITGNQLLPSIATNSSGTIKVMYYSTQADPTNRNLELYEVRSTNHAVSFEPSSRVGDVAFDRPLTNVNNANFDPLLNPCYMGDYIDVEAARPGLGGSTPNAFYLTWGDNRLDGDPNQSGTQPDPDVRLDIT